MAPSRRVAPCLFAIFITLTPHAGAESVTQTTPPEGLRQNTPREVVLRAGRVVVDPQTTLDGAAIHLRDGRIIAVGAEVATPPGATEIDLSGKTIYAGFIDAYAEWPADACRAAGSAESARYWNPMVLPHLRVASIFKVDAKSNERWRGQGIVARHVAPSFGVIKGVGAVVSMGDEPAGEAILASDVAMHLSLNATTPEAGYPDSPMGSFALLRQALYDTQWYADARAAIAAKPQLPAIEANASLAALGAHLSAKRPFVIDVPDEMYLTRAAAIADEFGLRGIVRSGGYDYRLAEEAAKLGMPIIVPLNFPKPPNVAAPERARSTSLEQLMHWDLAPENPARLRRAGARVAFTTDGLKEPGEFLRSVRITTQRGLSRQDALAALTTEPAAILGIDADLGTISPGKLASLVVTDGDLLDEKTRVLETWVNGERFELPTARTALLTGTWAFRAGDTRFSLAIEREGRGTLTRIDDASTQPASKQVPVELTSASLAFMLTPAITGRHGVATASCVFDGSILRGSLLFADGTSAPLEGVRAAPTSQPTTAPATLPTTTATTGPSTQATTKPTEKAASFEPNFPLGSFGRNCVPPQPAYVWIRNATLWTSADAGIIDNGEIVLSNGKIEYVGKAVPRTVPVDAMIIDASGKHVTPGIIDAHSHIATDGGVNEAGQAITCEVRIGDFIDATQMNIYRQLAGGVTTANILHGSANAIGGQNQVIKLRWGALPADLKFAGAKPGVKFALGENPKQSNWGDRFNTRYPQTRMGVEQLMLDAFEAAGDYQRRWDAWNETKEGLPPRRDLELDALVEIIRGKRMVHCHSYRQDEILALIRTAERIGFKIDVFQHILEGYKVAPEMQKHGAMASSFSDWWAFKFEVFDAIPYNGALMKQAGIVVSFNSDDAEMARRLNTEAAKAVKYGGVEPAEAFKFVTINAARQLFVDDRVGSLERGKDADLVIWSGSPLSPASRTEQTWIDGRKYFDRQDDLRERERFAQMKQALVQKVLVSGSGMAEPGEFPKKPSALLADHDEYCTHGAHGAHGH